MTQPVTWPEGARCAIMMTFDLEGERPWIHRDPARAERPLHMSMGAYGPKTGMPRILELLDLHAEARCRILVAKLFQHRYLPIDDSQHLKDVGSEPIAPVEQEHVESGSEVACDSREGPDLTSTRASVDHLAAW